MSTCRRRRLEPKASWRQAFLDGRHGLFHDFDQSSALESSKTLKQNFLQLQYNQLEYCPNLKRYITVGVNHLIRTANKTVCLVEYEQPDSCSLLTIADPKSKTKRLVLLTQHKDTITIYPKENKKIIITKNEFEIGRLTYK